MRYPSAFHSKIVPYHSLHALLEGAQSNADSLFDHSV